LLTNKSLKINIKIFCIIGTAVNLSACAYYPKQIKVYDSDCNIEYKKLVLGNDKSNMRVASCENEACIAAILSIPLQALVAGSIVVAGNVVYWFEKEGTCLLKKSHKLSR